jgi:hypothetical protein
MKPVSRLIPLCLGLVLASALIKPLVADSRDDRDRDDLDIPRNLVKRGLEIAPVPLDLHRKNRALVGLGSYIVNAQAGCNDCHSCPSYLPGQSPFTGGDGRINAPNYLAGGVEFGPLPHPVVSANITPDGNGRPAGLTLQEFIHVLRTGEDPDTGGILQVMPWPIYRNMTDRDLAAVYEYLRAIPHADTPTNHCPAPGL